MSQIRLTNSFLIQAAYSPGSGMRIDKVRSKSKIQMSKIQGDLLCHAFLCPSVLRCGLADQGHGPDKFSQVVEIEPGAPPNPASPPQFWAESPGSGVQNACSRHWMSPRNTSIWSFIVLCLLPVCPYFIRELRERESSQEWWRWLFAAIQRQRFLSFIHSSKCGQTT